MRRGLAFDFGGRDASGSFSRGAASPPWLDRQDRRGALGLVAGRALPGAPTLPGDLLLLLVFDAIGDRLVLHHAVLNAHLGSHREIGQ